MTGPENAAAGGSLAGRRIWLTRPAGAGAGTLKALRDRGAEVLHLPMLEIEPMAIDARIKEKILNLDRYQLVFFVSGNAARLGLEGITTFWPQLPVGIRYFAVGPGTAREAEAFGLEVVTPRDGMDSESLLALPELREVEGCKALIFRGEGGREALAEGLRERGAEVDYAEVYRRRRPDYSQDRLRQYLASPPDTVVITSGEALRNFHDMVIPLWPRGRDVALFVPSARVGDAARALGFSDVRVMRGASERAVVASLEQDGG